MIYPVDLNAKYVAYNTVTLEVHKIGQWPRADGMEIVGLDPDLVMLKYVIDVEPVYDPLTHSLSSNLVIDVPNEEYRREWITIPLSQEDLDEIQEDNELSAERQQAIAVYQDLKNGVGNSNQRLARVEKVLAHLLRKEYRP